MSPLLLILIIVLIVVLFGGGYGYRVGWHQYPYYGPSMSVAGVLLVVLVILLLFGRL